MSNAEALRAALSDMGDANTWGPMSFAEWCQRSGVAKSESNLASTLSVQALSGLPREFRRHKVMLLRCGGATGTEFALVRAQRWPSDFFLVDGDIFLGPAKPHLSKASLRDLFPFQVLKPVERSLVNLAFTTGVVGQSLSLSQPWPMSFATGGSTYDFSFRPHSAYDLQIAHRAGQLDVDALFVAERQGSDEVFVLEAKYESTVAATAPDAAGLRGTLAKSKLAYPMYAIRPLVPAGINVTGVYLRVIVAAESVDYLIAECAFAPDGLDALDTLSVRHTERFRLPIRLMH